MNSRKTIALINKRIGTVITVSENNLGVITVSLVESSGYSTSVTKNIISKTPLQDEVRFLVNVLGYEKYDEQWDLLNN